MPTGRPMIRPPILRSAMIRPIAAASAANFARRIVVSGDATRRFESQMASPIDLRPASTPSNRSPGANDALRFISATMAMAKPYRIAVRRQAKPRHATPQNDCRALAPPIAWAGESRSGAGALASEDALNLELLIKGLVVGF